LQKNSIVFDTLFFLSFEHFMQIKIDAMREKMPAEKDAESWHKNRKERDFLVSWGSTS
jgi:hypothetical protein